MNKRVEKVATEALASIKQGGLALVKADIGYGLLGHSTDSIRQMYKLKGRSYKNRCIVAGNYETLEDITIIPDHRILKWIKEITSVTTVAVVNTLRPDSRLFNGLPVWVQEHASESGTVATFLNTGEFVSRMVEKANKEGILLVGSSGNKSGTGNNYRFEDVPREIREQVAYSHSDGPCKYANVERMATTIINLSNFTVRRRGVNAELITASYANFAAHTGLPPLNDVSCGLPWCEQAV